MSSLFISHASADRAFIDQELEGLLRALGFEVWYSEEEIKTGEDWERVIRSGLESCKWFVVLMSPTAAQSKWVKAEVRWAIDERPANIIPVLIGECNPLELHMLLPQYQHVDFRENRQLAREQLVRMLVEQEYRPGSLANIVAGLLQCPSKESLVVVRVETKDGKKTAKIIGANAQANRCFGRKANDTIVGTSIPTLIEELFPRWMDPDDLSAFLADQRRVFEALEAGEEIYARVPFKFNRNHPYAREFAGESFLPVAIAYSNPVQRGETTTEDLLMLYANVGEIVSQDAPGST